MKDSFVTYRFAVFDLQTLVLIFATSRTLNVLLIQWLKLYILKKKKKVYPPSSPFKITSGFHVKLFLCKCLILQVFQVSFVLFGFALHVLTSAKIGNLSAKFYELQVQF